MLYDIQGCQGVFLILAVWGLRVGLGFGALGRRRRVSRCTIQVHLVSAPEPRKLCSDVVLTCSSALTISLEIVWPGPLQFIEPAKLKRVPLTARNAN